MSRATDYDRVQADWMTEEDLQHWFPVAEPVAGESEWCDGCHRRGVNTSGLCSACETETNEDREFWR